MNQREVWENIARDWNDYRKVPPEEAAEFIANKSGLLLDLGCGSGRNFIQTDAAVIGADFSYNMLRFARKNAKERGLDVHLAVSDAIALPFKDDSFDAILAFNLLPSVKFNMHKKVLEEIKRVSKNGSAIFISAWNKDQPRFAGKKRESFIPWKTGGKEYQRYYYLYSKDEFQSLLKKHFKNVKVFYGREKAFKKYSKNIIAVARVAKSGQRRKA